MAPIEHVHAVAVFQQLHTVDIVHKSSVCQNIGVDGREEVYSHQVTGKVVVMVLEQTDQRTEMCFIDVAQGVIRTHDLVHPRVDFHVHMLDMVQRVYLNGLPIIIRHRRVAPGGFLC